MNDFDFAGNTFADAVHYAMLLMAEQDAASCAADAEAALAEYATLSALEAHQWDQTATGMCHSNHPSWWSPALFGTMLQNVDF